MNYEEAIERLENLKVKVEIALSNSNTSCEWLKEDVKGTITAYTMAIEALEKQISKKPVWQNEDAGYYFDTGEGWVCICPTCGEYIDEYEHHCKCGQRIDWSDDEYEAYQDEMGGMAEVVAIEVE